MPSFVNVGARVGRNTMVDTWATVGSCAQIGSGCHISGGAGIGGVLEPLQAAPVVIEDECFIGARSEVAEGVIVERGSVLSMGVFLGASTKIVDAPPGRCSSAGCRPTRWWVPGTLPGRPLADGSPGPSLYCAVIVKTVDAQTRSKTSINELLREVIDPVALAQALIRCPSVTPADAGALDVVAHALAPLGFAVTRLDFDGTPNLFARLGQGGPHFCFAGHTDVVPAGSAGWSSDPFSADLRDGALFGRGACDMKGRHRRLCRRDGRASGGRPGARLHQPAHHRRRGGAGHWRHRARAGLDGGAWPRAGFLPGGGADQPGPCSARSSRSAAAAA